MIGLDTNILVRLLIKDDEAQLAAAESAIAAALENGEPLFISSIVLCELEWVLTSCYSTTRADLLTVLESLIERPEFEVESPQGLRRAVEMARNSRAEISDCLIAVQAEDRQITKTLTFDRALRRLGHFEVLGGDSNPKTYREEK